MPFTKKAALAVSIALASPALQAHDFTPVTSDEPLVWQVERFVFMPNDVLPRSETIPGLPMVLHSVLALPNKWANNQSLRVCFVGGSADLRNRILAVAQIWFAYVNLTLDGGGAGGRSCTGINDTSEIRIGFREPGYWSYIGNDSLHPYLVTRGMTSMNFQNFDRAPPSGERFQGLVLHEFGHALGFHHEHQNPSGSCEAAYDWDKVKLFYKTQYNWDETAVNNNVRPLVANRSAYDWSELDRKSVMIYATNNGFLKNGASSNCIFKENNLLSELDKKGAARAYPKDGSNVALAMQASTVPVALGADGLSDRLKQVLTVQNNLAQRQLVLQNAQ